AYAVDCRPTDHESWTIMPEVIKNEVSPVYNSNKKKGSAVFYGDKLTLLNNGTGQKLHSHDWTQSPITSQQEVTCQTWNNMEDNWSVEHDVYNITSEEEVPWNECHNIVLMHDPYKLGLNSHHYMLNDKYQEVTCFGNKVNTSKWRAEILYNC
ncbi:15491_t:CDS:2, partial [Cetraspora pellucida]